MTSEMGRSLFKFIIVMSLMFSAHYAYAWKAKEAAFYRDAIPAQGVCSNDTPYFCAPGFQSPNQPGSFDRLEYLRWLFLITGRIVLDDDEMDVQEELWFYAEEAHDEVGSKAGSNMLATSDPSLQSSFDDYLISILNTVAMEGMGGPYYGNTFAWYVAQNRLDQNHNRTKSTLAEEFAASKEEFVTEYILEKAFAEEFADEVKGQAAQEKASVDAERLSGENWAVAKAKYEIEYAEALSALKAKQVEWIKTNAAKASSPDLREKYEADAHRAFEKRLAALRSYPYLLAETSMEIARQSNLFMELYEEAAKEFAKDELQIAIDLVTGFREMQAAETSGEVLVKKGSTFAHDAYVIVPASIEATVATFQFRNGIAYDPKNPGRMSDPSTRSVVFPKDPIFLYRREIASDMRHVWGADTWLNESLKFDATVGGLVRPNSDAYAIVMRGNMQDGVDILFQFIGTNCPTDATEGEDKGRTLDECETPTKSNMSIAMIRPFGENRTILKMSSRFVGQKYTDLKNPYSEYGFNWKKLYIGWGEFNQEAKQIQLKGKAHDRGDQDYYGMPMRETPVNEL